MHILLVEDELLIRILIAEYLTEIGHAVVQATTGDEAAAVLAHADFFDVIITDIHTPGQLTGLDLARNARQRNPAIPIIVASAYAANFEDRLSDLNPAAVFIKKPYDLDTIGSALERIGGKATS